jgi:hypothetical protein
LISLPFQDVPPKTAQKSFDLGIGWLYHALMTQGFRAELPDAVAIGVGKGRGILQMAVVIDLKRQFAREEFSQAVRGLVPS